MDLYLPYNVTVLNAVLNTFQDIEMHTGLTISYEKTSLYRIGSIRNSNAKLFTTHKIHWTNDPINTLGIDLFTSESDLITNYEKIIVKMQTISKLWFYRSLTLMGKILIVNTLMASLFTYKLQVLPVLPDKIV